MLPISTAFDRFIHHLVVAITDARSSRAAMSDNEIRLPTCRSEEAGERSDSAPERRHVPKGKPRAAKRSAAQRRESVIRRVRQA